MPLSFTGWRERVRTDKASFRQMAQTLKGRLSIGWSKFLNSITTQKPASRRVSGTLGWLKNRISRRRARHVRRRQYKLMTGQFQATLKTCCSRGNVPEKEMKEAKEKWREAMRNVREEDERRRESVRQSRQ